MNIIKFRGRGKIESLILINGNTAKPQHELIGVFDAFSL